jgi:hypothetical protein
MRVVLIRIFFYFTKKKVNLFEIKYLAATNNIFPYVQILKYVS